MTRLRISDVEASIQWCHAIIPIITVADEAWFVASMCTMFSGDVPIEVKPTTHKNWHLSEEEVPENWLAMCLESDRPNGQTVHPRAESRTGFV